MISSTNLVNTEIIARNDECIIMNKKELQMADTTSSALDNSSEVIIILASGIFGYWLNLSPAVSRAYVLPILFAISLFIIGFYLRAKRKTTISEILKMYKQK